MLVVNASLNRSGPTPAALPPRSPCTDGQAARPRTDPSPPAHPLTTPNATAPGAQGRRIGTIEGLAEGGRLHPVQQQFLEHAALQCGFCTPGLLVAAKALLDRNPDPTETEVRYWLAGNLCRCTGYDKIVRAVLDAAAQLRAQEARP